MSKRNEYQGCGGEAAQEARERESVCSTPAVCLISDPLLDTEEEMVPLS